jgi:hypothetical protein
MTLLTWTIAGFHNKLNDIFPCDRPTVANLVYSVVLSGVEHHKNPLRYNVSLSALKRVGQSPECSLLYTLKIDFLHLHFVCLISIAMHSFVICQPALPSMFFSLCFSPFHNCHIFTASYIHGIFQTILIFTEVPYKTILVLNRFLVL